MPHVLLRRVVSAVLLAGVVVLAVHPVGVQLPPLVGEEFVDLKCTLVRPSVSQLEIFTINSSFLVELEASSHSVLAVLSGESDAEGEGSDGEGIGGGKENRRWRRK